MSQIISQRTDYLILTEPANALTILIALEGMFSGNDFKKMEVPFYLS